MTPRRARILLVASFVLLGGVLATWWTLGGDGGADLVGAAVTSSVPDGTTRADAAPTTTAPPALRPPGASTEPVPGVPVSIAIPSLGIDDPVVPVGAESDGSMEVPGADEVGWWDPGPRPGATHGSSVLAAHVDFDGRPGVFRELQRLELDSEVVVTDEAGVQRRYRVTERFQVGKDELPRAELFRTGGPPSLTLVTCGGAFDRDDRHYADNIVVRAVPEPSPGAA